MASHHRRKSSVDRVSIESILNTAEPTQPAAVPSAHIGNSPNRASFAMSPPPRPTINHTRALSYTPRNPNRLSLSFPIATSTNSNESSRPTPTSSTAPSIPATPADLAGASPTDSSEILVAIAGQERRVLELKEELEKAEADLTKLKRQWVLNEAHKKKAERKNFEQLQPLQTVITDSGSDDAAGTPRQSAEMTDMERRKALLTSPTSPDAPKEVRRKFSGQHIRALSLLSPERSNFTQSFPPVRESGDEGSSMAKSTTTPDLNRTIRRLPPRSRNSYHGGVTHGAKQIAEDIKSGVWTFLEDLRQATVGNEAAEGADAPHNGTPRRGSKSNQLGTDKVRRGHLRRETSTSPRTWDSLIGNSPLLEAAGNLWDMDQPSATPCIKKKSRPLSLAAPIHDLDDDWSNWDTSTPSRWSGTTLSANSSSDPATPSKGNLDGRLKTTDHSADDSGTPSKREELQWPALDKLSPGNIKGNLQRTMSTIMKEWEKSITPPPGDREDLMSKSTASQEKKAHDAATQAELVMMSR